MARSCVVILLLGVLAVGAAGEDATDSVAVNEAVTVSSTGPPAPKPAVLLLLSPLNRESSGNSTELRTSQENSTDPEGPHAVLVITAVDGPEANGTEIASNGSAGEEKPEKSMIEGEHDVDSKTPLVREKRTFKKHKKGCMLCGMMPQIIYHQPQPCTTCHQPVYRPPPPPPPQQYCDPCQRRNIPPPSPCGGSPCGGGHPGGGGSWSYSSAQSSSGSWGRKKK